MTSKKDEERHLKDADGERATTAQDFQAGDQKEPAPEDYHPNARVTPPDEQLNPSASTAVGQLIDPDRDADDDSPAFNPKDAEAETKAATTTAKSAGK